MSDLDTTAAALKAPGDTTVLVIGAGLGGCAAAAFLAHAGLRCVLVERHESASTRPRAWIISPRTLELLRELRLDGEVMRRGSAAPWDMVSAPNLLATPDGDDPADPAAGLTPDGSAICDQDILEDILRSSAVEAGADVRWAFQVDRIIEHADHVEVLSSAGDTLRADYVLLAEGARADLLTMLEIGTTVPEHGEADPAQTFDSILFRSPELDRLMAGKPGNAFVCTDADSLLFRRDLGRWQLQRQGKRITDPPADIAAAVGRRIAAEVYDHSDWTPSAKMADSYRSDRVFLVGDTAHSFPPSLGMGGNAAIADAHNLAWKLLWVASGRAGAGLLDSYDVERRPVGEYITTESVARTYGSGDGTDMLTIQLGIGYPAGTSTALAGDGDSLTFTDPHDGQPVVGTRVPFYELPDGRNTLGLAAVDRFAVISRTPTAEIAGVVSATVPNFPDGGRPESVWLVRPDGHIAAHLLPDEVPAVLRGLLATT